MIPVALPSTEVTIDGEVYTLRSLDGITCFRLYSKLFNMAGAALKEAGALASGSHEELGMGAIGALMANLSPELAEELRATFAASCCVQKEGRAPELKLIFGQHFARRPAHMSKWMIECAKWNFADFLDGDLLAKLLAKLPGHPSSASKSPRASTGFTSES